MGKAQEKRLSLLFQMITNSKRSDRDIAKILDISQPSVTRLRRSLEKDGLIREYTVIPDLAKMGYEIIACTFLAFSESRPDLFDKARAWTKKQSCVIFAHNGEGLGMNSMMISAHRNYASFSKLITTLRQDWEPNLKDAQSFLISINRPELLVKAFSFKYLEPCK